MARARRYDGIASGPDAQPAGPLISRRAVSMCCGRSRLRFVRPYELSGLSMPVPAMLNDLTIRTCGR